MHSTVIVGRMDPESIPEVSKIFAEFDSAVSPGLSGLRRRQLYTYYDVFVQLQDFVGKNAVETGEKALNDPAFIRLGEELAPYIMGYAPAASNSPSDALATSFYQWQGPRPVDEEEGLHSTVIVNRVDSAVVPEVARLFGELDATDFPLHMGTRRRQLFSHHGVYLHIQDFERANGNELIDKAWKEADPRFIQICGALDPLVKKYDPDNWRSTADQIGTRFYHWEASA